MRSAVFAKSCSTKVEAVIQEKVGALRAEVESLKRRVSFSCAGRRGWPS
jgi:hypothetical protein